MSKRPWVVAIGMASLLVAAGCDSKRESSTAVPRTQAAQWLQVQSKTNTDDELATTRTVLRPVNAFDEIEQVRLLANGFLLDTGRSCVMTDREGKTLSTFTEDVERLFTVVNPEAKLASDENGGWIMRDRTGEPTVRSVKAAIRKTVKVHMGDTLEFVSSDGKRVFLITQECTSPDSFRYSGPIVLDRVTGDRIAAYKFVRNEGLGWGPSLCYLTGDGGFVFCSDHETIRFGRDGKVLWRKQVRLALADSFGGTAPVVMGQYVYCEQPGAPPRLMVLDANGQKVLRYAGYPQGVQLLSQHYALSATADAKQWQLHDLADSGRLVWSIDTPPATGMGGPGFAAALSPDASCLTTMQLWEQRGNGQPKNAPRDFTLQATIMRAKARGQTSARNLNTTIRFLRGAMPRPKDLRCKADGTFEFRVGHELIRVEPCGTTHR